MKYTPQEWQIMPKEEKLLFFLEQHLDILQGDIKKLRKEPENLPQICKVLSGIKTMNNDALNLLKNALGLEPSNK